MQEVTKESRIVPAMRDPIDRFVAIIEETGGGQHSLIVFGAALTGSFDPRNESVRSALVMDRIDLDFIRRLSDRGSELGRMSIAAPLIMTPDYIRDSLDTFPLEYLEISQLYEVVIGSDLFANLTFQPADVRLQCERELKSILIGLRQGLLASAGRDYAISALEVEAAANLLRTLRGICWLKEIRDYKPALDVLTDVESIINRKMPGVRACLDESAEHGWNQFENLYNNVAAMGDAVNAW